MSTSTRPSKYGLAGSGTQSLLSSKPLTSGSLTSSSLLSKYGTTSGSSLLGSSIHGATRVEVKDAKLSTKEMKGLKKSQKSWADSKKTEKLTGTSTGLSSQLTSSFGQGSAGYQYMSGGVGTSSLGFSTKSSLLSGSSLQSSLLTSGTKSSLMTFGSGSTLSCGLKTERGKLSGFSSKSTMLTSGTSSLLTSGSLLSSSLLRSSQLPSVQAKKSGKKISRQSSKDKKARDPREEARRSGYTDFVIPDYHLDSDSSDSGIEMVSFIPPDKDESLISLDYPIRDIEGMKRSLINAVSGSLIRAPNFKETKDPVRLDLITMADGLAYYDAEFILKLALYTRNELNIRTTGNFLLAYASNNAACRPYLKKYYSASIRLPSDWIDVAEQYQAFYDKNLNFGSLPAALRRVMVAKFAAFDKYQLAKYNKESSRKKKKVPTATLR